MEETILYIIFALVTLGIAYLWRDAHIRSEEIRAEKEFVKSGHFSQLGKRGAEIRWGKPKEQEEEEAEELGPWVEDMLSLVGMTTDVLFEDEMPPMLRKALPAIKGFLETSGGIEKIIGRFSAGEGGLGAPGTDGGAII